MPRQRRSQAEAGGEIVVPLGAVDQPGEAALGEFRAGIVQRALYDVVVAALHQHVGDCTAQHPARGDRHQMRLALAARGLDQRRVIEPLRFRQHGAGDLDRVVERERADGLRRRGVDRRQTIGEQGLGRQFNVHDQALKDIVEQADLSVGIVGRSVGEQVGDAAQRLDAARDGAMRQRGLQLIEQVIGGRGGFRTHGLYLCPGGSAGRAFFASGKKKMTLV